MKNKAIIEVTEEYTKFNGTEPEILAGLSMMLYRLKNTIDEDKIRYAVNIGLADKEKRADILVDALRDKLENLIDDLLEELDEEDKAKEREDLDEMLNKLRKKGK